MATPHPQPAQKLLPIERAVITSLGIALTIATINYLTFWM